MHRYITNTHAASNFKKKLRITNTIKLLGAPEKVAGAPTEFYTCDFDAYHVTSIRISCLHELKT